MTERLLLMPRPRLRDIEQRRVLVTDLVTLQRYAEGGIERIRDACQQASINWCSIPLDSRQGTMSPGTDFVSAARFVAQLIELGRVVGVHCAAGIHRTGMVGYGALRLGGMERNAALDWIRTHRPVILSHATDKLHAMDLMMEALQCGRP